MPDPETDFDAAAPVLIACAHGTDDAIGRQVVRSIVDDIRRRRPDLDVREAFVDVQDPALPDVVSGLPRGARAVIVPLLLSVGFHTAVDIAEAAASTEGRVLAAEPLGPDCRLAAIIAERLRATGATPADRIVLAAAGSSRPEAATAVGRLAASVRDRWPGPVSIGYGAGAHPRVPVAVETARGGVSAGDAGRVVIASYLLAPGYFHDRLVEAGADRVTAPLGPDPRLAEIALDRYAEALVRQPVLV